jgi:hypothetical protein
MDVIRMLLNEGALGRPLNPVPEAQSRGLRLTDIFCRSLDAISLRYRASKSFVSLGNPIADEYDRAHNCEP